MKEGATQNVIHRETDLLHGFFFPAHIILTEICCAYLRA